MRKLTDRMLAQLFHDLDENYKPNSDHNDLNNFIYYSMQPGGLYADLDVQEKNTVWRVLDIYMELKGQALLHAKNIKSFKPFPAAKNYDWKHSDSYYDSRHSNTFFFISTNDGCGHRSYGHSGHHTHGHCFDFGSCCGGGNSDSIEAEIVKILVVILIAIIATFALLAWFYLARQILNDLDRIWYNEGRLQAVLSLTFMAGTATAMGMLMNTLLTGAFASFLLTVGFSNPIAWAIFTVVCVAAIATVPVNWCGQVAQDKVIKLLHPDALDPMDPYRFALTASEASRLEDKGIDPLRVRCAIVNLHASVKREEANLYSRKSLFNERSSTMQSTLDTIRGLRDGSNRALRTNSSTTQLTGSTFSLIKPKYNIPVTITIPVATPVDDNTFPMASAPPQKFM